MTKNLRAKIKRLNNPITKGLEMPGEFDALTLHEKRMRVLAKIVELSNQRAGPLISHDWIGGLLEITDDAELHRYLSYLSQQGFTTMGATASVILDAGRDALDQFMDEKQKAEIERIHRRELQVLNQVQGAHYSGKDFVVVSEIYIDGQVDRDAFIRQMVRGGFLEYAQKIAAEVTDLGTGEVSRAYVPAPDLGVRLGKMGKARLHETASGKGLSVTTNNNFSITSGQNTQFNAPVALQGSGTITQASTVQINPDFHQVADFLAKLREVIPALELPPAVKREVEEDVATCEQQLQREKPKIEVIKSLISDAFQTVRAKLLEKAGDATEALVSATARFLLLNFPVLMVFFDSFKSA